MLKNQLYTLGINPAEAKSSPSDTTYQVVLYIFIAFTYLLEAGCVTVHSDSELKLKKEDAISASAMMV